MKIGKKKIKSKIKYEKQIKHENRLERIKSKIKYEKQIKHENR